MKRNGWLRYAQLCGLMLPACVPVAAHGAEPDTALRITFAPGQAATVQIQPDRSIAVLFNSSGKRQTIPRLEIVNEDSAPRLRAEDVDFDGHPELVVSGPVGMVNEAVAVYRYDPGQEKLVSLEPASHQRSRCGGLMGLDVDAANRTLSSSCRSGSMWYVDLYRYHDGRLYLYRAERALMLGDALEATIFVKQTAESGPMAVWSTFDPAGKVLETAISDGLVAPRSDRRLLAFSGQVVPARLPLYARPGDTATRRYLVRDDRVELLDENDGWVKVRYANPTQGDILGWVNANP